MLSISCFSRRAMTNNAPRSQGVLGTFLTGSLGLITGVILLFLVSGAIPWIILIASILWLVYIFVSPYLRKKTEEAASLVEDDD